MTDDARRETARVARDLTATVEAELPKLAAIGEDRAGQPIAAGKWSRKQVIGHLIDSALNNQQRFVRAQLGAPLSFPGYAQEEWVAAQAYQQRSWAELLTLWTVLNRHLAHVVAHIDPKALETPCTIGAGAPVTLRFIAEDYVRHLRHHLAQVLAPEVAAGKTHPPYA
jgi:DinB family protein